MKRNVPVIIFLLSFLSWSVSADAELIIEEFGFSYSEPKQDEWALDQVRDDNKIILNYGSRSAPKREFSILVKRARMQNVSAESTINEFKRRLPNTAEFGEAKEWTAAGGNGLQFEFHIPDERSPMHALALVAYKNGYMYNIVVSKYCCSAADDEELASLIGAFRIE